MRRKQCLKNLATTDVKETLLKALATTDEKETLLQALATTDVKETLLKTSNPRIDITTWSRGRRGGWVSFTSIMLQSAAYIQAPINACAPVRVRGDLGCGLVQGTLGRLLKTTMMIIMTWSANGKNDGKKKLL